MTRIIKGIKKATQSAYNSASATDKQNYIYLVTDNTNGVAFRTCATATTTATQTFVGDVYPNSTNGEIFNDYEDNIASGDYSHAEGFGTEAQANYSHAEGSNNEPFTSITVTVVKLTSTQQAQASSAFHSPYTHCCTSDNLMPSNYDGYAILCTDSACLNEVAIAEVYQIAYGQITDGTKGIFFNPDNIDLVPSGTYYVPLVYCDDSPLYTRARGTASHAEGVACDAYGDFSHSEGYGSQSLKTYSHAEGYDGKARGTASHAEGVLTRASGDYSHAEGFRTIASGTASHAEGNYTTAYIPYSHAEGGYTIASGTAAHAEGYTTRAYSNYSHAEGFRTIASGNAAHAEGYYTTAYTAYSHAEGCLTRASGSSAHAEGYDTFAKGYYSHAEGYNTIAYTSQSHAEGGDTIASGDAAHAEGYDTFAKGNNSHAEGYATYAIGIASHAEGLGSGGTSHSITLTGAANDTAYSAGTQEMASYCSVGNVIRYGNDVKAVIIARTSQVGMTLSNTLSSSALNGASATVYPSAGAMGNYSHSEGVRCLASGYASHAEGTDTRASSDYSHAEGYGTYVSGAYSHAEGYQTSAVSNYCHAEGCGTHVSGYSAHAGGLSSRTSAIYSFVHGEGLRCSGTGQVVFGRYNATAQTSASTTVYPIVVGWGGNDSTRSTLSKLSTAGTWSAGSDVRLKDDIKNIDDDVIDAIGNVPLRQFTLKAEKEQGTESATTYFGVIAQEVVSALTEHNVGDKKANFVQHDSEDDYYSVSYRDLLIAKYAYYEKVIAELEARLESLEKKKQIVL